MKKRKLKNIPQECEWSKADLQKLLASLKANIPASETKSIYTKGLRAVNWNKVAFPPYSPEQCERKWHNILLKMRKIRTLPEIIMEAEDVISNPTHNIKIHPELPIRPKPPNSIFYEEKFSLFRAQKPKMSTKMLLRLINNKYKALPEEEKSLYEEKFNLANEEYKRKMEKFRNHYYTEPPKTKRRKSAGSTDKADEDIEEDDKDSEGLPPKPPCNGYNLFCKEQRASIVGVSKMSYISVCAQRWRDLTEEERDEYNTRYAELKKKYAVELNDFLMTLDKNKQEQILNKYGIKRPKMCKGIKRKVKPKILPGEPKMPSRSANVIFCKEQMEVLKEVYPDSTERFGKCNRMWQDLPNKMKERYKEKANENFEKYSMELQNWFKTLTSTEQQTYRTRNPKKCQYLDAISKVQSEEHCMWRPSDSEDEDIDCSSNGEEDCEEDEDEEEEEDDEEENESDTFELF